MKKILFGLLICFACISQAQALPGTSTIKGATLFCSSTGNMFAINFKNKQVWSTDPGEKEGFELTHVSIRNYRCPDCYDISGNLFGAKVMLVIRRQVNKINATATVSTPDAEGDGPDEVTNLTMTCKH
jgi:hypothetical protein